MSDRPQYPAYPGPEQPPEPPPGYNPPPPSGYQPPPPGYHPPPPQGYGQMPPSPSAPLPTGAYASWLSRVGATLIDGVLGMVIGFPLIIGYIVLFSSIEASTEADGTVNFQSAGDPLGWVLILAGTALSLAFALWNLVFRQGRKGQSVGKSVVGIKVVKEATGLPMGAGLALGRYLLSSLLTSVTCYLNLLWPLWDDKNQTLHDKVVSTVVVRAS